jgi:hypothetical protein
VAVGTFDNAKVTGLTSGGTPGATLSVTTAANGDITISWTGAGTLQSSENLGSGANWTPVTPAPTGNSYTIVKSAQGNRRFYRVVQ